MSKKMLFVAFITLGLMAMNIPALGANVTGKVIGRGEVGIQGVTITVAGTGACDAYSTTTNSLGEFIIDCDCEAAGSITASFSMAGYAQAVATYDCDIPESDVIIIMPDIGVPSMTTYGAIVLVLLLAATGVYMYRRRRVTA